MLRYVPWRGCEFQSPTVSVSRSVSVPPSNDAAPFTVTGMSNETTVPLPVCRYAPPTVSMLPSS